MRQGELHVQRSSTAFVRQTLHGCAGSNGTQVCKSMGPGRTRHPSPAHQVCANGPAAGNQTLGGPAAAPCTPHLEQSSRQQAAGQALLQHAQRKAHLGGGGACRGERCVGQVNWHGVGTAACFVTRRKQLQRQWQAAATCTPGRVLQPAASCPALALLQQVPAGQHPAPTRHALPQHQQLGEHDVGAPAQLVHKQLLKHGDVRRGAAKLRGGTRGWCNAWEVSGIHKKSACLPAGCRLACHTTQPATSFLPQTTRQGGSQAGSRSPPSSPGCQSATQSPCRWPAAQLPPRCGTG